MTLKFRDSRGLTLVELVVVIAIIGILAAILAPNALNSIEKSKVAATLADFQAIKGAALGYYADTGAWPPSAAPGADPGLYAKVGNPTGWNGPYLDRWAANSPLGCPYIYNRGENLPSGLNMDSKYKFITLTGISTGIRDRLEKELDGNPGAAAGSIRYEGSDGLWRVYFIISEY